MKSQLITIVCEKQINVGAFWLQILFWALWAKISKRSFFPLQVAYCNLNMSVIFAIIGAPLLETIWRIWFKVCSPSCLPCYELHHYFTISLATYYRSVDTFVSFSAFTQGVTPITWVLLTLPTIEARPQHRVATSLWSPSTKFYANKHSITFIWIVLSSKLVSSTKPIATSALLKILLFLRDRYFTR